MSWGYISVDAFDHKEEILSSYTIKELKKEIEDRLNDGIDENEESVNHICYISIDPNDYVDEFLEACSDSDLINEVEKRELEENFQNYDNISRSQLTSMLGLRPWANNEQIIEEIKNFL
jgi:hypothetical protein